VDRRPGQRAVQITAITALAGVVAALVGLALVARPLRTPTQDCGTALTFLVSGGVNEYVDPSNPPEGITAADAEDNNADPCQERAGDRALPALLLVVGGTAIGVGALIAEWSLRDRMRRRAHRLHRAGPPTAGAG
jgi:hypothetical protein